MLKNNTFNMLKDKITFVTGSNRGIGLSIVRKFAENGATVYANARKSGSLDVLQNENYESAAKIRDEISNR